MSRLTNTIRADMARRLVNHRYTDEAKELVRLNHDLASRVHKHLYTPATLAQMATLNKTFPGLFSSKPRFVANLGGYQVTLGGALQFKWVSIPQEREQGQFMVASDGWSRANWHSVTDEKLIEEGKAFATRVKNFDDVCKTAYHEALSVLNTMTTGKKLAEAWPEAIPVIGDLIPEGERTLPVVQVSAINAKFKLPPKTKE